MDPNNIPAFYDGKQTILQRMQQWMNECCVLNIPFRQAAIVGAVAWNESACMMRVPRSQMLVYDSDCLPARPPLVIENGNPNFGTNFPASWTGDQDLMAAIKSRNWVNASGTQLLAAQSATDGVVPNDTLAWIFEWLIDNRKAAAIGAYSIGPTQMYMKFSPLASPGQGIPSRLPTFDLLWAFYTATNALQQFQTQAFDYLPTTISGYPTPNSQAGNGNAGVGNTGNVETYLQAFQTGSRDWDSAAMKTYARNFLAAVKAAWAAGRNAGQWLNDPSNDMAGSTSSAVSA